MTKEFCKSQSARHVTEIVNSEGGSLSTLMATAQLLQHIDCELAGLLPAEWGSEVRAAGVKGQNLTLAVTSGAIATRLRMDSEELCAKLGERLRMQISSVQVFITHVKPANPSTRKKRELSEAAKATLQSWQASSLTKR